LAGTEVVGRPLDDVGLAVGGVDFAHADAPGASPGDMAETVARVGVEDGFARLDDVVLRAPPDAAVPPPGSIPDSSDRA